MTSKKKVIRAKNHLLNEPFVCYVVVYFNEVRFTGCIRLVICIFSSEVFNI